MFWQATAGHCCNAVALAPAGCWWLGRITVRSRASLNGQRCHAGQAGSHRPPERGRPDLSQCFPGWDMDDVAVAGDEPILLQAGFLFQVSLARLQLCWKAARQRVGVGWLDVESRGCLLLVPVPGSREIRAGRSPRFPCPLLRLACHAMLMLPGTRGFKYDLVQRKIRTDLSPLGATARPTMVLANFGNTSTSEYIFFFY